MGKIRNSKSVEEMKKYITAVVSVIVGAFATSCGVMAVINKIAERNVNLLRQKEVYILFLGLSVLFGIGILLKYKKGYSKRITRLLLKGQKEDDEISGNLESVHFQIKLSRNIHYVIKDLIRSFSFFAIFVQYQILESLGDRTF